MTARQINTFRRLLEAERSELEKRIQRMRDSDSLAITEHGDALDRVRNINERDAAASAIAFEVRLLQGVQEALREIRAGTFGRCAACDGEIPLRRLKAVPWSPYCIRCQAGAEARMAPRSETGEAYYAQAG